MADTTANPINLETKNSGRLEVKNKQFKTGEFPWDQFIFYLRRLTRENNSYYYISHLTYQTPVKNENEETQNFFTS